MSRLLLCFMLMTCLSVLPQKARPVISPQIKPSVEFTFNPEGYYFSNKPLQLKYYSFEWLSVFAGANGSYNVQMRLTNAKGKWEDFNATKYVIKPGATYFSFNHKVLGKIEIAGKFTGTNGPAEDDVKVKETVVFKGRMIVKRNATPLTFTWWEGD